MPKGAHNKLSEGEIDRLNIKAWEIRVSDSIKAFELTNNALKLATRNNYLKGKAEALRTLGFCYIRFSKHQEALGYLEEALVLLKLLKNLHGLSDVYEYFGIIKRSLGDYKSSLNFLSRSLDLRTELGYFEGKALSLYHLGVTYKYIGDYEQALDNFMKSLTIARLHNYSIPESYSLNNIGLIYFETGDYSQGLKYFYESLAIRRKEGDKWGEAGCLDSIGLSYYKTKEYDKAIDFCTQSLNISQSTGDKKGHANSVLHLGNIYEELNDFEKALFYYNKGLSIRKDIKDKKGEAEIMIFIAGIFTKHNFNRQNNTWALELMNNSLKIGNEIEATDLLIKIHYGLYEISKQNQLPEIALMHLEKYITIQKQVHSDAIQKKIFKLEMAQYEKQLLELEARALRAQMNPHFIFNCMNSIKALVQQKEEDKAVNYLTTFSKLIRTIFQNSDKREISLYDEIETCKLYTQLESMRFGKKFSYHFDIDETIDLKSILVPALIIQPFIENAIWHGIMPKEDGGSLSVSISRNQDKIACTIDDDGIGRETSKQNKFKGEQSTHQSKGVHLTQSRLDLNNALNQRNAILEIIDKKDNAGNATGTTVVLTFVEF